MICVECTTQFEGINRCATCLGKRLAKARQLIARNDWSIGNLLLAATCVLVVFGGFYGLAKLLAN